MVKLTPKRKKGVPLTCSEQMATIRSQNTKPEMLVRRALHAVGLRFRIHVRGLPGTPDIVFRPAKLAIFVHGCFWHRHANCRRSRAPATRTEYWMPKFARTIQRDRDNQQALRNDGWKVFVLWECEASDRESLAEFIEAIREQIKPRVSNLDHRDLNERPRAKNTFLHDPRSRIG